MRIVIRIAFVATQAIKTAVHKHSAGVCREHGAHKCTHMRACTRTQHAHGCKDTHTRTHARAHTHTNKHLRARTHTNKHTHLRTHARTHARTNTNTHTCARTRTNAHAEQTHNHTVVSTGVVTCKSQQAPRPRVSRVIGIFHKPERNTTCPRGSLARAIKGGPWPGMRAEVGGGGGGLPHADKGGDPCVRCRCEAPEHNRLPLLQPQRDLRMACACAPWNRGTDALHGLRGRSRDLWPMQPMEVGT